MGSILIVRLGAMGDILHALPAVAALKRGHPGDRIAWAVHPKWRELLEGSGLVDELIFVDRRASGGLRRAWGDLRRERFDFAVDFQGLIQSALVARAARAERRFGFCRELVREKPAAMLYSDAVASRCAHVVDRNLDLAEAAGGVGRQFTSPLPEGRPEGSLPAGPYVLAAPFAGWVSKQWPLERYAELASLVRQRGVTLVLNGAPAQTEALGRVSDACVHVSSVAGLIHATRGAAAVVGVDSGPLHLAAALAKPGVAIFGPTDPARNGPYGGTLRVLRRPDAVTTYRRGSEADAGMRSWTAREVFEELEAIL